MKDIRGGENLSKLVPETRLNEFNIIEVIEYRVLEDDCELLCVLRSKNRSDGSKINLRFLGVTTFSVAELNWQDPVIMGFVIKNISDQGWEGLNWEVLDYENNRIHFYARDAEVLAVVPAS